MLHFTKDSRVFNNYFQADITIDGTRKPTIRNPLPEGLLDTHATVDLCITGKCQLVSLSMSSASNSATLLSVSLIFLDPSSG